jgi:uncharacterized protein
MDLHHPILREFPEHRETIKLLKASSDEFRTMFQEYHTVDESIYRIEEEIEFASDQEIEALKKRRAWLKDRIYYAIRHAPSLNGFRPFVTPAFAQEQLSPSAE